MERILGWMLIIAPLVGAASPAAAEAPAPSPAAAPPAAEAPTGGSPASPVAESPTADSPAPPAAEAPTGDSPAPPAAESPSGEPITRRSDALTDTDEQWATPGFRVLLITGYSFFAGGPSVEMAHSLDLAVHAGWRLNPRWALMGALRYSFFLNGLSGARWTATVEPVLHLDSGFLFSAGAGYGGIWASEAEARYYDYDAAIENPFRVDLNRGTSDPQVEPFVNCSGDGIAVTARAGYRFIIGEVFSTGPTIEINGQWTLCNDQEFDERVPRDTDVAIPQQWWSYFTAGISWVFAWR